MPNRRETISTLLLLILIAGLAAALVRGELENYRLRAKLATAVFMRPLEDLDAPAEPPMW